MDIVKLPKKLRDILSIIRSGQIDSGLEQLSKIKDFEPQKAIALAEISYFREDFAVAMDNDEKGLPFDEQWYAGNILFEHFYAYSNAAIVSGNTSRAEAFLLNYLANKEASGLPLHRINTYKHQVSQNISKLKGEKGLEIDAKPLEPISNGRNTSEFIEQLKKYRPKFTYDSSDGAKYLLNFMFNEGNTDECLDYYEKYANELDSEEIHLDASRLYVKTNRHEKAKTAILQFATKCWYPVEAIQVMPMRLLKFEELNPILTKEFKNEILLSQKAIPQV